MIPRNEGTIVFWLKHEHKDWATNSASYNFGVTKVEGISAEAVKHPDKTLEIKLGGPFEKNFTFRNPVPPCDERGLQVAMVWKGDKVQFYLNGQLVETKEVEEISDETN